MEQKCIGVQPVQTLPRSEYPRPDFTRHATSWLNLNGEWEFAFDDEMQGLSHNWQYHHFEQTITVPFAFQSQLSGITDPSLHDYMWYGRDFELPLGWLEADKRCLLHFGAVDYHCRVWVNGHAVGAHTGGHVPFSFDVTSYLQAGKLNRLVVFVEDTQSKYQPRGKQYWQEQSEFCFYTRTSGIWQTVWLESVPEIYLNRLRIQPDIDSEEVSLTFETVGEISVEQQIWLHAEILLAGTLVWRGDLTPSHFEAQNPKFMNTIRLPKAQLWSPETPTLYDLHLTLYNGVQPLDSVQSYFGMRKISCENGRVLLNNQPYYLRFILDQGYFPDGLLTAPSDDALRYDIEMTKAFGFNGARKHQKVEDPRWLYWADKLGLLVWGEMPSAYEWSPEAEQPFIREWLDMVVRDYNHPSIMTWVPFNESWGLKQLASDHRQVEFVKRVVAMTRDMDRTRFVIDNDGWEHVADATDLLTIHDYTAEGVHLLERYTKFELDQQAANLPLVSDRPVLLPEARYRGEPIILTEFGGISLIAADKMAEAKAEGDWGYSNAADSQRLIEQYRGLIKALQRLKFHSGFCYTQLTDVEQEVNGLLTYDRKPKVDPRVIAEINMLIEVAPESDAELDVA